METLIDESFEGRLYAIVRAKPKWKFVEGALIVSDKGAAGILRFERDPEFGAACYAGVG
jgi:hypothetical protein